MRRQYASRLWAFLEAAEMQRQALGDAGGAEELFREADRSWRAHAAKGEHHGSLHTDLHRACDRHRALDEPFDRARNSIQGTLTVTAATREDVEDLVRLLDDMRERSGLAATFRPTKRYREDRKGS